MAAARFEDDQRARVTVAGESLEYCWVGPSSALATLVFLHEGLGSIDLWRDFPTQLCAASSRRGLLYSRMGNGWSDPLTAPREPYYMHREALTVLPEVLESMVRGVPILIGHSDGASIAVIAAGSSQMPIGLVLIAPHVFVEDVGLEAIARSREGFIDSDVPTRMAKYHSDPAATFWGWNDIWLSPAFRDWNLEQYLPAITCPVLLVQGDADEFGTTAQLDSIESHVQGPVERVMVPGAGHSPHLAEPDLVTGAIAKFLAGLS